MEKTHSVKDAGSPASRRALHLRRIFLLLVPLLLTGCYTVHMVQCTVPDNETNRVTVTNIVASVAIKHAFVGHPEQADQVALLASYNLLDTASKRPLELDVYADAGTITALLSQTTKNRTRPDTFFSVERDLITGFKGKFGSAVEVDISHEKAEP